MRVGIDYQILALGPELITRGMGRYTQQQLREVLAVDTDNEYVLLCDRGADLSLIDPVVRDAGNVDIRCYTPPRDASPDDSGSVLRLAEHYQDWVYRQGVDLYHATAPLLLQGPPLVRFDACPMVSTLYDLIPLRFPEHYLDPHGHRDTYLRTLGLVARSERLLAISDTARNDAVSMLGVPAERIDRAWPIADDVFRPLPDHLLRKLLLVVASHVRLPERYVLAVTHVHYSKNLETLLRGYGRLPATARTSLPLVVCCHLDQASIHALRNLAAEIGVQDDLVVTGRVTDEELCALYNRATLVVHPSRSEGFGFPVLEAMRCGAPVVTTTAASLPEVAGEAAVLVDPEDAGAFAAAISQLVEDPARREVLARRGFEQAARFNRHQLAEATLACYRQAVAVPPTPPKGRHIAVWTPLPPQPTGIADYSAELIEGLASRCDLEVFVDGGFLPPQEVLERHRIHHWSAYERRDQQAPFDAVVYQVGASPFHYYMAQAMQAHPGIVALHDLVWSNVLYSELCHVAGDAEAFRTMLAELHGNRAVRELGELDFGDQAAVWDFFGRYPMLEPVIAHSRAQIVHFQDAAVELAAAYPGTHPHVVPMGVADPRALDPGLDETVARGRLGLDTERFVAGIFGIVHPLKRIEACIEAFAQLRAEGLDGLLLVAGAAYDLAYADHLAALARRLGAGGCVEFTGHLPRESFDTHLAACDVVVNLRAPVHKHMSAVLMRAVAAGRPVVVSDLEEWRFLPETFCRRIPTGDGEVPALREALVSLAGDPAARARMAAAARAFYEREGTVDRMAARYLEVVEQTCNGRAGGAGRYNPPVPSPQRSWT